MKKLCSLIIMLCVFLPSFSYAAACFVEKDKAGCFRLDGKKAMKSGKTYTSCNKIIPTCKDDRLCYLNTSGGISCLPQEKIIINQPINIDELSKGDDDKSIMQALMDIFSPQPERRRGLKSLKTNKELAGFPDGYILMPDAELSFVSVDELYRKIDEFKLLGEGDKKILFSLDKPAETVSIPRSVFSRDTKYQWEAVSGSVRFIGSFGIEKEQYQQEFEQELAEIYANSDASDFSKSAIRASLAKKYGYTFDYLQSIHKARSEMNVGGRP